MKRIKKRSSGSKSTKKSRATTKSRTSSKRVSKRRTKPSRPKAKSAAGREPSSPVVSLSSKAEQERRMYPRIPICARVKGAGWERFTFTRDLSAAGLFLICERPPAVGSIVDIELAIQFLPSPVELQGKVVRLEFEEGKCIGCAVQFVHPNKEIEDFLRRFGDALSRLRPTVK